MLLQLGLWAVNSAKYWKNTTFVCIWHLLNAWLLHFSASQVGFDLVDVQIPVKILPDDEGARIEWVHGNM